MSEPDIIKMLCLVCGEPAYVNEDAMDAIALKRCPACGDDQIPPADLDQTLDISITSYELRVIFGWAESYIRALKFQGRDPEGKLLKVLHTIVDRLSMQTSVPLTREQDIANAKSRIMEMFGIPMIVVDMATNTCNDCGAPLDSASLATHRCQVPDEPQE